MSLFGEDVTDNILNNDLNENIFPGEDEDDENDNEGEGDENEIPIKIEPKKKSSVKNPRQRLTLEILKGSRGIHTIEDYFKDIKFHGKGHEKKDLDDIMLRLTHWAHRMYPNYKFEDVLTNIDRIGKKKALQVHMSRYRLGMLEKNLINTEEVQSDVEDQAEEPFDEFDALLGEQIAISKLAPKTPKHNHTTYSMASSITTPNFVHGNAVMSTPNTASRIHNLDSSDLALPLPPSQPPTPAPNKLSAEQMAKIAENRRLAQERLKLKRDAMGQI